MRGLNALIACSLVLVAFSPMMVAEAGSPSNSVNANPPAVWGREVIYPGAQIAAKTWDYVQLVANVKDNDTGIDPWWNTPPPVYIDLSFWGQGAQVRMYDDGKHMDGVANDSRFGSPPILTNSPQSCAWEPVPLVASEAGGGPTIVTSITVAIDNLEPKFRKEAWAIYPPGQTAYKEGDDAKFGTIASDRCVRSIDVVFNTDDSGSMTSNDPMNLRIQAICRFATTFMEIPDRGTGVFFYGTGNPEIFPRGPIERHLHDTYPQICSDAQTAQSSGGTDGWESFRKSLDELIQYGDPNKIRMIIFLTDGSFNVGPNNTANTILGPTGCKALNIPVYTVLLDPPPINLALENQMKYIARECNALYFHATNANVLDPIFQAIGKNIKRLPAPYGIDWMWLDGQPVGASRTIQMDDDGTHDDGEEKDEIWGTGPMRVTAKTSGTLDVYATARDIAGNTSMKNITFKMDNCLPDVTDVKVNPARVTDGQTVTVTATVQDTLCNGVGGLESVWVDASSIGGGATAYMTCAGTTCTSPPIRVQTRGYIGDKRVNVNARDVAFNRASDEGKVAVDNAFPNVSPVGLVKDMVLHGSVLFQASAKDAVKVEIAITGPKPFGQQLEYSKTTKLWKVTVDTLFLPDGAYDVAFKATDLYGDTDTSVGVAVRIDNTPPTLAFAKNVFEGAYVDGTQVLYSVSNARSLLVPDDGTWTSGAAVEWRLNGGAWKYAQAPIPCPNLVCPVVGSWITHLPGPGQAVDGAYTIEGRITDIAGRQATVKAMLYVDNTPPEVKLFSTPPLKFPTNGVARFGIDATDKVGVASVDFEFQNALAKWAPANVLKGDDGYYWFDLDTKDIKGKDAKNVSHVWEGEFSYKLTVTDVASGSPLHDPGATQVTHITIVTTAPTNDPLTFRVDNYPPKFDSLKVDGATSLTRAEQNLTGGKQVFRGKLFLNATVHDEAGYNSKADQRAGVKRVDIRIDGGEWRPMTLATTPPGPFTELYSYEWDGAHAENGAHLVEFRAEDKLGHVSEAKLTVWVDNPDFSSSVALIGMLLMVLLVMLPWVVLFHRAKRKAIGSTAPAGYKEYMEQNAGQPPQQQAGQQGWGGEGGNIQW